MNGADASKVYASMVRVYSHQSHNLSPLPRAPLSLLPSSITESCPRGNTVHSALWHWQIKAEEHNFPVEANVWRINKVD